MKQLDPNWIAQRLAGEPPNELGRLADDLALSSRSALRGALERSGLEAELAAALLAGFRADDARVLHRAKPHAWFRDRVAAVVGLRFHPPTGTVDAGDRVVLERIALDVLEAHTRPDQVIAALLPRITRASGELRAAGLAEALERARDGEVGVETVLARVIAKKGDLRSFDLEPCQADASFVVAEILEALGVRAVEGGTASADVLARAVGELEYTPSARFHVGDVVRHAKFGRGLVTAVLESSVEIDFDGVRRRLARVARP
jgi:hypothetical protein